MTNEGQGEDICKETQIFMQKDIFYEPSISLETGNTNFTGAKRNINEKKEIIHICNFEGCGKMFAQMKNLKRHMNLHVIFKINLS
jgi:hypothetical protein